MAKYLVRPATLTDQETIVEFNLRLARETEDKSLNHKTVQQGVARILVDTTKGRYFVATWEQQVVGQIMFTYEWSDWRNGDILWIQSVFVHPDFRRQGVFRLLHQAVQAVVDGNDELVGIRLYVEKSNASAQATYRRIGFSEPGYTVMESLP